MKFLIDMNLSPLWVRFFCRQRIFRFETPEMQGNVSLTLGNEWLPRWSHRKSFPNKL